jgi:hypothetical protein
LVSRRISDNMSSALHNCLSLRLCDGHRFP